MPTKARDSVDPLELELQADVGCEPPHRGAVDWALILCKNSPSTCTLKDGTISPVLKVALLKLSLVRTEMHFIIHVCVCVSQTVGQILFPPRKKTLTRNELSGRVLPSLRLWLPPLSPNPKQGKENPHFPRWSKSPLPFPAGSGLQAS